MMTPKTLMLSASMLAILLAAPAAAGWRDVESRDTDIFGFALGDGSDQVANCIIRTSDGGFAVTGFTYGGAGGKDIFVAKFDSQCDVQWQTVFGGAAGGDDEGRCIVETSDHDLVVVGYTTSSSDGADFFLARYRPSSGYCEWNRRWGGGSGYDEKLYSVIEASDETLWAAGFTKSYVPEGRKKVLLARIGTGGTTLTCARAGKVLDDWDVTGMALAEVFDTDGFCVTGTVIDNDLIFGFGQEILLAKFDDTPAFLWARRFGDDDTDAETATSIIRTSDGCLAIAGSVVYPDGPYVSRGGFILKTDADATVDWGRFVPGFAHYYSRSLTALTEVPGDRIVAVGKDHGGIWWDDCVLLVKWDFDGTEIWSRSLEGGDGCIGNSVVVEGSSGSLLVAGSTDGYGLGGTDVLAVGCDSFGQSCLPPAPGAEFSSWSQMQQDIVLAFENNYTESTSMWPVISGNEMTVTWICGRPPNDLCPDAIMVSAPSLTFGTTDLATIDDEFPYCGTSITSPGVWYSLIGTGCPTTATTCGAFYNYDTKISVYSGSCEDPICVGGNDDDCPNGASPLLSTVRWCAQEGEQYWILVHGYGVQTGDFLLEVYEDPCPADVNGDGVVDVLDLLLVLAAWGPCLGCPEDINCDGVVDVLDLLRVLEGWGPCP